MDFSDVGGRAQETRAPAALASIWILALISALFLCGRVYCRLRRRTQLWWDDFFVIAAWVCILITCCLITYMVSLGFGKHTFAINPAGFTKMSLTGFVSSVFSLTAIAWSKTSFAFSLLRFMSGWQRVAIWFAIMTTNILLAMVQILFFIQCKPVKKNWMPMIPGDCWPPNVSVLCGVIASAYSGCMDLLLVLLAWPLIWSLRVSRPEKMGVTIAISMGILAACAAFVKSSYGMELSRTDDFSYIGIDLTVWSIAESSITVIVASIPILRALIQEHFTQYLQTEEDNTVSVPRRSTRSQTTRPSENVNRFTAEERRSDESIFPIDEAGNRTGALKWEHAITGATGVVIRSYNNKDDEAFG